MTNGEKIKEIFPNIIKYGNILIDDTGTLQKNILFDDTWWNAEYKEPTTKNCESCEYYGSHHEVCNYCYKCSLWTEKKPTTKNDLALIHTEGLDEGIRCAMCTNSIKSDRGCDGSGVVNNAMYKAVMDVIENHIADTDKMIELTTKNNLGVEDCVSRAEVLKLMKDNWHTHNGDWAMQESMDDIRALPSVTSQESRKGHWIMHRQS